MMEKKKKTSSIYHKTYIHKDKLLSYGLNKDNKSNISITS